MFRDRIDLHEAGELLPGIEMPALDALAFRVSAACEMRKLTHCASGIARAIRVVTRLASRVVLFPWLKRRKRDGQQYRGVGRSA